MTTMPFDAMEGSTADEVGLVASLQARLAERLVTLRRSTSSPASLDRRIALIGGMLLAAGAVLVVLGWYGAAHTSRVYLQIPYLISGGLLGVVLAFAGGSAYLASWLTRLIHDQQARADDVVAATRETADALRRVEALLARSLEMGARGAVHAGGGSEYVATPSGRLAHRPTCPAVAGRTDLRPVLVDADRSSTCRMCADA